jgi:hypothetical protein
MVRYACEADMPKLLELCRQEHQLSQWKDLAFDARAAEGTIRSFLMMVGRTLLVTEGGYLAGLVQPMGFTQHRVALEYAWYAADGSGMALLQAFEQWAQRMGAVAVVAHNYTGDARLADVLARRRHYSMVGEALTKRLEH